MEHIPVDVRDVIEVPRWWTTMIGGIAAVFVPWAVWMTLAVSQMSVKVDMLLEQREAVQRLESHVAVLESRVSALEKVR